MSFYNDNSRTINKATMMGMWANAKGSQRMAPNIPGPTGSNSIQSVLDNGNFCAKWWQAVQAGDVTAQEGIISALATQLNISKTQATSILKRMCEKPNGRPPVGREAEEWCKRFQLMRQQAEATQMWEPIQELFAFFASQYGVSVAFASNWFKRNCDRPSNGSNTEINWADLCKRYLAYMQSGNMSALNQLYSEFAQQTGTTNLQMVAELFRRECGHPIVPPGPDNGTETIDCPPEKLHCYKCQNGNPVGMSFDPIKSSKADGKGYHYDCPKGWVIHPNPCKTIANGNGNNNTVLPIRDVDNNVTIGTGTSSGNNNTVLPIRDTNNTISGNSSSSGTGFGTATPNRNLFFSGGI